MGAKSSNSKSRFAKMTMVDIEQLTYFPDIRGIETLDNYEKIPWPCLLNIFEFLDIRSIARLNMTCKYFHRVGNSKVFWKAICDIRFPNFTLSEEEKMNYKSFYLTNLNPFGVNLTRCESEHVSGIGNVPRILVHLKREIEVNDGFSSCVGIFRIASYQEEMKSLKEEFCGIDDYPSLLPLPVDDGERSGSSKIGRIRLFANLIKQWLRMLPSPILGPSHLGFLAPSNSNNSNGEEEEVLKVEEVLNRLEKDGRKNVFVWMLDLILDIAAHEQENKMSVHNMCIVLGGSLYSGGDDPIAALRNYEKVMKFLRNACEWRKKNRGKNIAIK